MNKPVVLTGVVCFILGIGCGFLTFSEKRCDVKPSSLTAFTSQGRSEIKNMVSGINAVLNEAGTEIAAEQTRMLQALTAREPNRNAADFYLAGMEEKRKNAQTAIDGLWLDAIERMPLIDKKTYMKLYMKNRFLRNTGIVVPPFIAADDTCAGEF